MPSEPQHVQALFLAAVEKSLPERATFLQRQCAADATLRQRVEALLRAHDEPGSILGLEQTIPVTPPDQADRARLGTQIGPYILRELLGEGGMGVVYVAEQLEPIRRKVALKIIKPGMDSRNVIARFEAERQVLALLDHPNIAKILDAGSIEAVSRRRSRSHSAPPTSSPHIASDEELGMASIGRPYFAMELVRGLPITEYSDEARLDPRARLNLFLTVCDAVQHAHHKGIIHRDLKPNNILVTLQAGQPIVKVIDFGVAKALNQQPTELTIYTGFSQLVGTPLYMSPEQAEMSCLDVDTRSDIYSLGVLLYELLTGYLPFAREEFKEAGFDGMRRMIREVDPPSPSLRVSTLDAQSSATVAQKRGIDKRQFVALLTGELDWIVMKALEKDRDRRYASAGNLAADIQRYIADEPVEAGPPSTLYRLRKLAQRHRRTFWTFATVACALLVGTSVAVWQAIEANRARYVSEERAGREKLAHDQAKIDRQRAEASLRLFQHSAYVSDIQLASYAWQRNDVARMRVLLQRHLPTEGQVDLRGFEWHYLWKHVDLVSQDGLQVSQEIMQAPSALYFVCYSPDGKHLAAAGKDARIFLFDAKHYLPIAEIQTHQGEVNGLAFTPDSHRLASAGDDGTVAVWDVATRVERFRFQAHPTMAFQAAYSANGKWIVTCGSEPVIRVWNATDGSPLGELNHHIHSVEAIAISNQGHLAAASRDGYTSIWDIEQRSQLKLLENFNRGVSSSIAFFENGQELVTGQLDGTLTHWNQDGALIHRNRLSTGIQSVALSPEILLPSSWFAVGDREGKISVLPIGRTDSNQSAAQSPPETSTARQWTAHAGRIYSLCFSPDGSSIVSAGSDGRLRLWNLDLLQTRRSFPIESGSAILVAQQQFIVSDVGLLKYATALRGKGRDLDGQNLHWWSCLSYAGLADTIFALDWEGEVVYAWKSDGQALGKQWEKPPKMRALSMDVSGDGQSQAFHLHQQVGEDLYQNYIEVRRGKVSSRMPVEHINCLVLSASGRYLALNRDQDIVVLDTATMETVKTLQGHAGTVQQLAFSANEKLLASVSLDRTVRVWDWQAGHELWSELAHEMSATSVAFSPDGRTIATAGEDATLRFWRWEVGRLALELPLDHSSTRDIQFSIDGQQVLVVHPHTGIEIFDASPLAAPLQEASPASF